MHSFPLYSFRVVCLFYIFESKLNVGANQPSSLKSMEGTYNLASENQDWFDSVKEKWSSKIKDGNKDHPSTLSSGSGVDASSTTLEDQSNKKLNVLLIIADDMRADLGTYGHEDPPPTPSLDMFASKSRVFRRAYAQFPDCAPSRTSFLTGLRPDRLGIDSHECTTKIPHPSYSGRCTFREALPGSISMPQYFREAGYISLSYGKVFHQGQDDGESWSSQEEFEDGYVRGKEVNFKNKRWQYEQWFDPLNTGCKANNHTSHCFTEEHSYDTPLKKYIDHKTASIAISSISKLANLSQPWFMAIGLVRPHLPFVCPGKFWDMNHDPYAASEVEVGTEKEKKDEKNDTHVFDLLSSTKEDSTQKVMVNNGIDEKEMFRPPLLLHKQFGQGASHSLQLMKTIPDAGFGEFRDFLPMELREPHTFRKAKSYKDLNEWHSVAQLKSDTRRGYRSCISFMDFEFGRIMSALGESGQKDSTVVAFISDHGFKLGEFDMWGKHSVLHVDVHVPMIIRHPTMKHAGTQDHQVVELVDLFPTLADLSGASKHRALPKDLDGQSLASVVLDLNTAPPLRKSFAVAQFLPFLKFHRCMAYTLIGRNYLLKRWSACKRVPMCSNLSSDSIDLQTLPASTARAIPFSIEHASNLIKLKRSSHFVSPSSMKSMNHYLHEHKNESNPMIDRVSPLYDFPSGDIALEIKQVMSMIVNWSQQQGKKTYEQFLDKKNKKPLLNKTDT